MYELEDNFLHVNIWGGTSSYAPITPPSVWQAQLNSNVVMTFHPFHFHSTILVWKTGLPEANLPGLSLKLLIMCLSCE